MKKYNYQTCIRMSDTLRDSVKEIWDAHRINESDYIRLSIAESVRHDTQNPSEVANKLMFVWFIIESVFSLNTETPQTKLRNPVSTLSNRVFLWSSANQLKS